MHLGVNYLISGGKLLSWSQKRCERCQQYLPKKAGHIHRCPKCRKKHRKEFYNKYMKEYMKNYWLTHPDKYEKHKERTRMNIRMRRKVNIDAKLEVSRQAV